MGDESYLDWPFFDDAHRTLAMDLESWCASNPKLFEDAHTLPLDDACRHIVRTLGKAGWLKYVVPKAYGGVHEQLDVRSICLIRETLAQRSGLDYLRIDPLNVALRLWTVSGDIEAGERIVFRARQRINLMNVHG